MIRTRGGARLGDRAGRGEGLGQRRPSGDAAPTPAVSLIESHTAEQPTTSATARVHSKLTIGHERRMGTAIERAGGPAGDARGAHSTARAAVAMPMPRSAPGSMEKTRAGEERQPSTLCKSAYDDAASSETAATISSTADD